MSVGVEGGVWRVEGVEEDGVKARGAPLSIPSWILFAHTNGSPPERMAIPALPLQLITLSSMTPFALSQTRTPTPLPWWTSLCMM